jgi:hypothetical protein
MQDLIAGADANQWREQGLALWEQQQYGEAVECFRRGLQCDPNDAELQFLLGAAYHHGNGVAERDYTEAAFWYLKAAEQGHAPALGLLGMMYEWSWGVPQDYAQAVECYRKAAELGSAIAGYLLGCCYWEGRGVPKSYEQAAGRWRKAAEQGQGEAAHNLGICYEKGLGVPQDREQAAHWYREAAETADRIPPSHLWQGRESVVLALKTPRGIEKWQLVDGRPRFVESVTEKGSAV